MLKDNSTFIKLGKKSEEKKSLQVNYFESQLQNQSLESATLNSVYEAIECGRHRLQNQQSFLSHEARRGQHQQLVEMQKHLDEASETSQEKIQVSIGRNSNVAKRDG